jgi:Na+/H+-dicarboxylate symporter
MIKLIKLSMVALLLALMTSGCESLKFKNLAKTGATTAVTYAVAGPLPAILNLGTSVTIDEVLPPENTIDDVKTKEQMWAFIMKEGFEYLLYGLIGFLTFTSVIGPWAADRRRKRMMKYDALKAEVAARRLHDIQTQSNANDETDPDSNKE